MAVIFEYSTSTRSNTRKANYLTAVALAITDHGQQQISNLVEFNARLNINKKYQNLHNLVFLKIY